VRGRGALRGLAGRDRARAGAAAVQRAGGDPGHPGGAAPPARQPGSPVPGGAARPSRPGPRRAAAHPPAGPDPGRGDRGGRGMTAAERLPVLVGVDGSPASRSAIEVGVGAARRSGRPLRLVHVADDGDGETVVTLDSASAADEAEALLADALAYATAAAPEVAVTAEVIPGDPAPTLLEEARRAALLVVGERGRGGFAGLLLGSVASHVAAHAAGPVIVARETPRPGGPVVVGADGSPGSAPAVEFAFAEAAARG